MKHPIENTPSIPSHLINIHQFVLDTLKIEIGNYHMEKESAEYGASTFEIGKAKVTFRMSKITPNKIGQFVTLWKRNKQGIIEPLDQNDKSDFVIIESKKLNRTGQFIFPKKALAEHGILSGKKEGKRGFRIYPSWDLAVNKQAKQSQDWQLKYFFENSKLESVDRTRLQNILSTAS